MFTVIYLNTTNGSVDVQESLEVSLEYRDPQDSPSKKRWWVAVWGEGNELREQDVGRVRVLNSSAAEVWSVDLDDLIGVEPAEPPADMR